MQVDAPSPHPMHSSSSSSSSAAVLAAKGERLRSLLFGAEHAERSGDLAGAQVRVERETERRLRFFLLHHRRLQASFAHV